MHHLKPAFGAIFDTAALPRWRGHQMAALLAKFCDLWCSMLLTGLPAWWVQAPICAGWPSMRKKGVLEWLVVFASCSASVHRRGETTMDLDAITDAAILPALARCFRQREYPGPRLC